MIVTRTVTIDGKDAAEFEQIKSHLESIKAQYVGWEIVYNPLLNRATAVHTAQVESL